MSYEEYCEQKKTFGQWPRSKDAIYKDARQIALRGAASALGLKYETLAAMVELEKCE
jgi:hypothetical protein